MTQNVFLVASGLLLIVCTVLLLKFLQLKKITQEYEKKLTHNIFHILVMKHLSKLTQYKDNLSQLAKKVLDIYSTAFGIKSGVIVWQKPPVKAYILETKKGYSERPAVELSNLNKRLISLPYVLNLDEIMSLTPAKSEENFLKELKNLGVELICTLKSPLPHEGVVAIVALGPKLAGTPYSTSEKNIMEILTPAIASMVYSIWLYQNVEKDRKKLDEKVFALLSLQHGLRMLNEAPSAEELYRRIVDIAQETLHCQGAALFMEGEKGFEPVYQKHVDDFNYNRVIEPDSDVVAELENSKTAIASPYPEFKMLFPIHEHGRLVGILAARERVIEDFRLSEIELVNTLLTFFIKHLLFLNYTHSFSLDPVTKKYSLEFMKKRLEEEVKKADRYKGKISIAAVHFYMPEVRTQAERNWLLRRIAETMEETIRKCDAIFGCRENDFIIIFPATPLQNAPVPVKRIVENLNKKFGPIEYVSIYKELKVDMLKNRPIESILEDLNKAKKEGKKGDVRWQEKQK